VLLLYEFFLKSKQLAKLSRILADQAY